jgi:hypothetical protein
MVVLGHQMVMLAELECLHHLLGLHQEVVVEQVGLGERDYRQAVAVPAELG